MPSNVRRFYYVGSPRDSALIHRIDSGARRPVEGDLTFCGRPVPIGWKYWVGRRFPATRAVCEKCL